MQDKQRGENLAVMRTSKPHCEPLTAKSQLIREWLVKFSLNANERLSDLTLQGYRQMWEEAFADLEPPVLLAAFSRTLKSCKFFPKVADILEHVERAADNSAGEGAGLKWQQVRDAIRLHYHPDLGGWRGPKLSERTRRAINAAGGLAYLSECVGDDLVFARKRFVESYLRWDELKQNEYLLPDGEIKKLLAEAAENLSVGRALVTTRNRE